MTAADEKINIGLVEEVILLPWKIRLPARIDTGAALSSLDARDIKIEGDRVSFKLPPKYKSLKLSLPIMDQRTIRSSEAREQRPVVEIDLCIGPKVFRAKVNLNDRSRMKYPFLIGRNILKENFLVNCERNFCAPPKCLEEMSK